MSKPIRIIQISDLHLFANPEKQLLGLNTFDSFRAVLESVEGVYKKTAPALMILTGDLSQDQTEESYQRVVAALQKFECQIVWVPGNHDDPDTMVKVFSNSHFSGDQHIQLLDWQIILLNTHWSQHVAGLLSAAQLDFLEKTLKNNSQNALIVFHHPPFITDCTWLEPLCLTNVDDFFKIIDKFPQVKGIICGHVHQEAEYHHKKVRIMTAPSTSIQFKRFVEKFTLDTKMPGFCIYELKTEGEFSAKVIRISSDPKLLPDLKSKGY